LFTTTWIHVFEEDEGGGWVFRPEDADIPLSRRPRERLRLEPDGTARVFLPAPDDRLRERRGTWGKEAGAIVIRFSGGPEYRLVERSPERLVVRVE
jgi:hypothetical protein